MSGPGKHKTAHWTPADLELRDWFDDPHVPEAQKQVVLRDAVERLRATKPPLPGPEPYEIPVVKAGSMDGMRRNEGRD
jgi:hypothetical protein